MNRNWAIDEYDDMVVIIPLHDVMKHEDRNIHCPCNPTFDENLLIHNSFDGREYSEKDADGFITDKSITIQA